MCWLIRKLYIIKCPEFLSKMKRMLYLETKIQIRVVRKLVSRIIHYLVSQIKSQDDSGKDEEKEASIKGELEIDKKIIIKIRTGHDKNLFATSVVKRDIMLLFIYLLLLLLLLLLLFYFTFYFFYFF